jgi:hypothetical protein
MPPSERPLGLSILAVISFAFAIFNAMGALYLALSLLTKLGTIAMPTGMAPEIALAYAQLPLWFTVFVLTTSVLKIALLIPAGIGYLQLRRYGKNFGSGYAVVSLVESAVAVAALPYGLTRDAVIGVLFAVYVLLAVNTMYKAYLTN